MTPVWRKASQSDGSGACVEVAVFQDGTIGVRDSKNPDGPKFVLTRTIWMALLAEAKKGRFDLDSCHY
jgi:hypothetical protein